MLEIVPPVHPDHWIKYDYEEVKDALLHAKAHLLTLKAIPFQRRWIKELQELQLKLEVGGSSKIEGADFAANELEVAIKAESTEELITRSQKQAHCLSMAYKWIASLPDDQPVSVDLIKEIRALALHYHFAAMHPFADGNGRTARALEALALQRAGLKDSLFIAMSNYYYDEKTNYLKTLADVRAQHHDLTPFLLFGLQGIALQIERLTAYGFLISDHAALDS